MCKRRAFTLVELLVVISIISLLMAILTASLQGARRHAKTAACMSNLRQWGLVFAMYAAEHDGKLIRNDKEPAWYYPIRHYYGDTPALLECPTAKKASSPSGSAAPPFGGTFLGWGRFFPASAGLAWDSSGSYGLNHWAYAGNQATCKPAPAPEPAAEGSSTYHSERSFSWAASSDGNDSSVSWSVSWSSSFSSSSSGSSSGPWSYGGSLEPNDTVDGTRYWAGAYVKGAAEVPLVLDCWWLYAHCLAQDPPPADDAIPRVDVSRQANYLCMDRHNGAIGVVFLDTAVRKVGLKELWTLKWHPQYNVAGPWTKAGGVQPHDWPRWIRRLKDY